jgi:hypothetical protein
LNWKTKNVRIIVQSGNLYLKKKCFIKLTSIEDKDMEYQLAAILARYQKFIRICLIETGHFLLISLSQARKRDDLVS